MEIHAHSQQQYDKWKAYLKGDYSEVDMYNIATTYLQQMINLFGWEKVQKGPAPKLFKEFAKAILPPKG